MKNYDWKQIAELVGIFAVVLSLLMVAFELRQSTAVATAQALYETNTVHDQSYRARAQYPELDALIEKGHTEPDSLSERERSQFFAWIRAIARHHIYDVHKRHSVGQLRIPGDVRVSRLSWLTPRGPNRSLKPGICG